MFRKEYQIALIVLLATAVATVAIGAVFVWKPSTSLAQSITRLSSEERQARAATILVEKAQRPHERSVALVSFTQPIDAETVKNLTSTLDLDVAQTYHIFTTGTSTFRGGHVRQPNESVSESLIRHQQDLVTSLAREVTHVQERIKRDEADSKNWKFITAKDKEELKTIAAMRVYVRDVQTMLTSITEDGVGFYGLQISGENSRLIELSRNPKVKIVEVIGKSDEGKAMPLP